MATTSWRRIDSYPGGEVQGRESATFSRKNNTLTVTNFRSQWRVTISGNDSGVVSKSYLASGTLRKTTNHGNPSWSANQVFNGSTWSGSISVGANATTISTRTRFEDYSGGWYNSATNFSIPALGAPSGSKITASARATTSFTLNASISSWGANATAGNGQRIEYLENGKSWSNQAYSTAASHSRSFTGKTSNQKYQARTYASNGGGKTQNSSTITFYTLPLSCTMGTAVVEPTSATIPISQNNGGGAYAITKQYRVQEDGGAWGAWTTISGSSIQLSGLNPSTDYKVQVRSTSTAGTTTGSTKSLRSLPAATVIYPDGTVANGLPQLVYPDGTVKQVRLQAVEQ